MIIPDDLSELNKGFFAKTAFSDNCKEVLGCTPFVGAGLSAGLGFPTWKGFLKKVANDLGCQDIEKGLEKNKELDFENAATELYKTAGGGVFFRNICRVSLIKM